MVLKVTDFTHIAWLIDFMHIEYNSVVVVRNGSYNDYLPDVMLCLFFWNMDRGKKTGRKIVFCLMVSTSHILSLGVQRMYTCS